MKLIVDNNILFSFMNPHSTASKIIGTYDIKLYAPLFILSEFEDHEEEILKKSKLNEENFTLRKEKIKSRIKFIELEMYKELIKNIRFKDEDDIPYLALAMKLKIPIWSNDKELKKQDKVSVFSTEEIVRFFP